MQMKGGDSQARDTAAAAVEEAEAREMEVLEAALKGKREQEAAAQAGAEAAGESAPATRQEQASNRPRCVMKFMMTCLILDLCLTPSNPEASQCPGCMFPATEMLDILIKGAGALWWEWGIHDAAEHRQPFAKLLDFYASIALAAESHHDHLEPGNLRHINMAGICPTMPASDTPSRPPY